MEEGHPACPSRGSPGLFHWGATRLLLGFTRGVLCLLFSHHLIRNISKLSLYVRLASSRWTLWLCVIVQPGEAPSSPSVLIALSIASCPLSVLDSLVYVSLLFPVLSPCSANVKKMLGSCAWILFLLCFDSPETLLLQNRKQIKPTSKGRC